MVHTGSRVGAALLLIDVQLCFTCMNICLCMDICRCMGVCLCLDVCMCMQMQPWLALTGMSHPAVRDSSLPLGANCCAGMLFGAAYMQAHLYDCTRCHDPQGQQASRHFQPLDQPLEGVQGMSGSCVWVGARAPAGAGIQVSRADMPRSCCSCSMERWSGQRSALTGTF